MEIVGTTLGRNCLYRLTIFSIFFSTSFSLNMFFLHFSLSTNRCESCLNSSPSRTSENFHKADLTLPATLACGAIHQPPAPDGLREETGADKELERGMEVDGREFCGLGLEVSAVRLVGRECGWEGRRLYQGK